MHSIVVRTCPLKQSSSVVTIKLVAHIVPATHVESLVQRPELMQVNPPQYPQGSDTSETA